jgi:hypothetical protein
MEIAPWQLAVAQLLLVAVALEIGHRLGRRLTHADEEEVASLRAAVIGLAGLLLAFSLSMAQTRYDLRKNLVVEEGNAIGTLYLRADVLTDAAAGELRDRLRRYIDVRIGLHLSHFDEARRARAERDQSRLQHEMWSIVMREELRDPRLTTTPLVTTVMNEVIDIAATRKAADANRVPNAVLLLLVVAITLAGLAIGYRPGERRRGTAVAASFAILATLTLFTLLDLDRPTRGLVRISEQPLLDARQGMRSAP